MRSLGTILIPVLVLTMLVACGEATKEDPPAKKSTLAKLDFARVELSRKVWFSAPGGAEAILDPGVYAVEKAGDETLRLTPAAGDPVVALAVSRPYQVEVKQATAVHIARKSGTEHVVLLLPGGGMLDAIGSSTGVMARGAEEEIQGYVFVAEHLMEVLSHFGEIPEMGEPADQMNQAVSELMGPVHEILTRLDEPAPLDRMESRDMLRMLREHRSNIEGCRQRMDEVLESLREAQPEMAEHATALIDALTPPYDELMMLVTELAQRLR